MAEIPFIHYTELVILEFWGGCKFLQTWTHAVILQL